MALPIPLGTLLGSQTQIALNCIPKIHSGTYSKERNKEPLPYYASRKLLKMAMSVSILIRTCKHTCLSGPLVLWRYIGSKISRIGNTQVRLHTAPNFIWIKNMSLRVLGGFQGFFSWNGRTIFDQVLGYQVPGPRSSKTIPLDVNKPETNRSAPVFFVTCT